MKGEFDERGVSKFPFVLVFLVLLLGALFFVGYLPRTARAKALINNAEHVRTDRPVVTAAEVKRAPVAADLTLSGSIQAVTEAGLYARTEGYVKRRIADIGDRVKAGDILAELESPEIDQQLRQARSMLSQSQAALGQYEAQLQQAKANQVLAQATLTRWRSLVEQGILSQQDGDEKAATAQARTADVAAAEANIRAAKNAIAANEAAVQRLIEIQSFQKVRAPYDGVITTRNVVLGTLVSPGSSNTVRELYRITQLDPLKVMVAVPQASAPAMKVGLECEIEVQELGNKSFRARVARTANALDISSRTLLTEVQFANPGGQILPGMYAQVKFSTKRHNPPLLIPSDSLLTGKEGTQVAVLRGGNRVHFQRITIGRDQGASTEVESGLEEGDLVVINPTDDVREGVLVEVGKNGK